MQAVRGRKKLPIHSETGLQILAIDLGKFKSVACLFNTETNQTEHETISIQRWASEQLLGKTQLEQIVIETSSIGG